jgi:hypothetical protein
MQQPLPPTSVPPLQPWKPPIGGLVFAILTALIAVSGLFLMSTSSWRSPTFSNPLDFSRPVPTFEEIIKKQTPLEAGEIEFTLHRISENSTSTASAKPSPLSDKRIKNVSLTYTFSRPPDHAQIGRLLARMDADLLFEAVHEDRKIYISPEPLAKLHADKPNAIADLQGAWVSIDPTKPLSIFSPTNPAREIFESIPPSLPGLPTTDMSPEDLKSIEQLMDALKTNHVFEIEDARNTTLHGQKAWDVQLNVDWKKLAETVSDLAYKGDEKKRDQLVDSLSEFEENFNVHLVVAKKDMRVLQVRFVDDADRLEMVFNIKPLSSKDVHITVPEKSLPLYEAIAILKKETPEARVRAEQLATVLYLQLVLKEYKRVHGMYPFHIEDLVGLDTVLGKVKQIPVDAYTNMPYRYQVPTDRQSFQLSYVMQTEPANGTLGGYTRFVSGQNTLTPSEISLEASTRRDSDRDGLSDADEQARGTNKLLPDTDGDGFTDKVEIDSHHDPLTNYKTGKRVDLKQEMDALMAI